MKLIKKGKAYVSDLTAGQIKEYRGSLTEPGRDDPYSSRSPEESLFDGLYKFHVLLGRVRIIKAHVEFSVIFLRQTIIQENAF